MTIKRPCLTCGVLTVKGYCEAHVPSWITRKHRPNSNQRGYTYQYRKHRAELLKDNPSCVICGRHGTPENVMTANHIIPLSKGGSDGMENLEPMCKSCNSKLGNKTR